MKRLICFLLLSFFFVACKKDGGTGDTEPPVVSIISPMNLASFSSGQKVPITASISDNDTLASIHLNIEGPDFIHYAYLASEKSKNLSEEISIPIRGKYSLSIEAFDKSGNHGLAKVEFIVN